MNFKVSSKIVACAFGMGLSMAPAQAASTTFAQFFQAIPSEKVFNYNDLSGAPAASFTAGGSYTILSATYLGIIPMLTTVNLNATAAAAPVFSGTTVTQAFSGTLSFTRVIPGPANALTITFTNAIFSAQQNTEAPTLSADDHLGATIFYSSDFADLSTVINKNFSLSFSSASTPLTFDFGLQQLPSSQLSGVGTFAATAVPEPSTWAFMVIGVAAIGMSLRSRRTTVAFS
jgi:hypothetical protein